MDAENKLKIFHTGILYIYENTDGTAFYHYQNIHQDKHRVLISGLTAIDSRKKLLSITV
jgi:hypothetical protein